MSTEANKRQIGRYYEEVLNGGNIPLLDELAVPDYDEHSPFPGQPNGIEGLKARVGAILAAFRPVFTLHELVGEGDTVAAYWSNTGIQAGDFMGIPPSGRTVTISGVDIHRLRNGRMAEHWHVVEELQMLQQLGVMPTPQGAAAS
jgi:predicted ester cyclase